MKKYDMFEYSIGNKYIVIMHQKTQTNTPQIINRIEIGTAIKETKACLHLQTRTGIRLVNKSLITAVSDITVPTHTYDQLISLLEDSLL